MTLYLQVTADKYELPVCVADTAQELARMTGASINHIFSSVSKSEKGAHTKYRKVIVE